ncbi:MAG: hypothetical protein KDB22_16035, partial [Planctomycetales bacterium]|nr:hypothetical protein [Planctomycetales bacterium]
TTSNQLVLVRPTRCKISGASSGVDPKERGHSRWRWGATNSYGGYGRRRAVDWIELHKSESTGQLAQIM